MYNTSLRLTEKGNCKKPLECKVYRTGNHQRSPIREGPIFKTCTKSVSKDPEVLYFNDKMMRPKSRRAKVLKECGTQTSKTILQLIQNDSERVVENEVTNDEKCQKNITKKQSESMNKIERVSTFKTKNKQVEQIDKIFCQNSVIESDRIQNVCDFEPQNQNIEIIGTGCFKGEQSNPTSISNNLQETVTTEQHPLQKHFNINSNSNTERNFNVVEPCTAQATPDPGFCYNCHTYSPGNYKLPLTNNATGNIPEAIDCSQNQSAPAAAGDAPAKLNNSPFKIGLQIHFKAESLKEETHTGQLSPDSLAGTPREDTTNLSINNRSFSSATKCLSDFTLDGSCHVQDCICNNNKSFLEKPLTQTFLEKNHSRIFNRSSNLDEFKSISFIDNYYHPNYIQEPSEAQTKKNPQKHRSTRTSSKTLNLPDNSFSRPRPLGTASTLMRPTFASSIKSQKEDVQTVNRLIPSMRRGRSISPKPIGNFKKFESSRKIPYIDQSRSDISSETLLVNATRNPEIVKLNHVNEGNWRSNYSFQFSEDLFSLNSQLDESHSTINDVVISQAMEKLCESDWKTSLRGLADIVEICRVTDPEVIYEYMDIINQRVVHLLRSPRSHVSRAACKAAGHLFEYIKDTRRPVFDEIVNILLHKTADTNKFIRQDANLALDCMVTHIATCNAVRALCAKGPNHKNPLVRCATARLLVCAIVISGTDILFNPSNNAYTRKTVVLNMAKLLEDKNLETRRIAERLYKVLSKDVRFDIYLRKYLEKEQIEKMRKNLIFIRKN